MKEEIAETIGNILSNNRKSLKKDITDCANDLNIPIEYLDAVERNFFSIMPNSDYTKSCIIKYVHYLDIEGADLIKIKSLLIKNFQDTSVTQEKINRALSFFYSTLKYSMFSILLIVSFSIIFFEESYKRQLFLNFDNLHSIFNKINLSKNIIIPRYEADSVTFSQDEVINIKKNSNSITFGKIIQLEAKDDLWLEIIDGQSKILISKNFSKGDRYIYTFKDGDILFTNNPSKLLIKYDNILVNTISNEEVNVIEIDLGKILN